MGVNRSCGSGDGAAVRRGMDGSRTVEYES